MRLEPHCSTNDAGLAVCSVLPYPVHGVWKGSALCMQAGSTPKKGKHNCFKGGLKAKLFGQPGDIMFTCSGLVLHWNNPLQGNGVRGSLVLYVAHGLFDYKLWKEALPLAGIPQALLSMTWQGLVCWVAQMKGVSYNAGVQAAAAVAHAHEHAVHRFQQLQEIGFEPLAG